MPFDSVPMQIMTLMCCTQSLQLLLISVPCPWLGLTSRMQKRFTAVNFIKLKYTRFTIFFSIKSSLKVNLNKQERPLSQKTINDNNNNTFKTNQRLFFNPSYVHLFQHSLLREHLLLFFSLLLRFTSCMCFLCKTDRKKQTAKT